MPSQAPATSFKVPTIPLQQTNVYPYHSRCLQDYSQVPSSLSNMSVKSSKVHSRPFHFTSMSSQVTLGHLRFPPYLSEHSSCHKTTPVTSQANPTRPHQIQFRRSKMLSRPSQMPSRHYQMPARPYQIPFRPTQIPSRSSQMPSRSSQLPSRPSLIIVFYPPP